MTDQKYRQQLTFDLVDELVFVLEKKEPTKRLSLTKYQESYHVPPSEMRSLVSGIAHDPRIGVTYEEINGVTTKVVFLKE